MSITACCTGSQNWDAVHQQDKGCPAPPPRTGQNRVNKLPISNPVGLYPHSAEIACDAHVKHSKIAARHAEIAKETKRINPKTRIGATRRRGSGAGRSGRDLFASLSSLPWTVAISSSVGMTVWFSHSNSFSVLCCSPPLSSPSHHEVLLLDALLHLTSPSLGPPVERPPHKPTCGRLSERAGLWLSTVTGNCSLHS